MPIYDPARHARQRRRKKPDDREHQEQCSLFKWARLKPTLRQYPALALLSSSLNGVKLSKAQAGKAKAAGMLKGEHDIKLPVARGGYIGLSIELKVGNNRPTPEQLAYGANLAAEGWQVQYCWGWDAARAAIEHYLSQPTTTIGDPDHEPATPEHEP